MAEVKVEMIDLRAYTRKLRRASLRAVARVTRKYARQAAPRRTGRLRNTMQAGARQGGDVTFVTSTAKHAHLMQRGVRPHEITPGKGREWQRLKTPWGVRTVTKKAPWHHPGVPANDFLARGLAAAKPEINSVLTNIIDKAGEMGG